MTTVTAETIWQALMADEEFAAQPTEVIEVFRPFVDQMPDLLKELLSEKLTVNSLMSARLKLLSFYQAEDAISKLVRVMPEESKGFFSDEHLLATFQELLKLALEVAQDLSGDITEILRENDITEEDVLFGEIGLKEELREQYQQETLTLGTLLVTQPMLIIKIN